MKGVSWEVLAGSPVGHQRNGGAFQGLTATYFKGKRQIHALLIAAIVSCHLAASEAAGFPQSTTLEADAEALLAFKSKLSESSPLLDAWQQDNVTTVCSWRGVRCSGGQSLRIVGLEFDNGNGGSVGLVGQLSPVIGRLGALQRLTLINHQLTGTLPSELSYLTNLEFLIVRNTLVTGGIPTSFGKLPRLVVLDLSRNSLSGGIPSELGDLPQLTSLLLERNQLTGPIPSSLGQLSSLASLQLGSNNLTGEIPSELASCPLTVVRLRDNQLSGPVSTVHLAAWCPRLEFLDLANNQLAGEIPPEIRNCSRLYTLTLSNNSFSGGIPTDLGPMTSLRVLHLDGNSLTGAIPATLASLKSLTFLDVSYNNLSGDIPTAFNCQSQLNNSMGSLRHFLAANNSLTGVLPNELSSCPNLAYIELQHNLLEGPFPGPLRFASNLVILRLQGNQFTGILPSLSIWPQLEVLDLNGNDIGGTLSVRANGTPSLRYLNLGSMFLDGELPEALGTLSALTFVDLSRNRFRGPLPIGLANASKLETLILSHNRFNGSIPQHLGNLTKLQALDLSANLFTGPIPVSFANGPIRTSLTSLKLAKNSLTGSVPVFESNLTTLDISSNGLTGPLPGLPLTLTSLIMHENEFSGPIPFEFVELLLLSYLDLSANEFSGPIPSFLGAFRSLRALNLSVNLLEGPIPQNFADLTQLELLDLSGNSLTGAIPSGFADLPSLQSFDVSNNNLEGQIPGGALSEFPPAAFEFNDGLCGPPTPDSCSPGVTPSLSPPPEEASPSPPMTETPPPPPPPPPPVDGQGSGAAQGGGPGGSLHALFVLVLLALLGVVFTCLGNHYYRRTRDKKLRQRQLAALRRGEGREQLIGAELAPRSGQAADGPGLVLFAALEGEVTVPALLEATENFRETHRLEASAGSFGASYRAVLPDGVTEIVVKRFPRGTSWPDLELQAELARLGSVRHDHIVPLIGAYTNSRTGDMFLLYPYMQRQGLDVILRSRFDWQWPERYRVAMGAAQGLGFLHKDATPRLVLRNFKAGNVLLGSGREVCVGDWSVAKLVDLEGPNLACLKFGTPGYAAPELAQRGQASTKSDVYAFGIVLLQLVTGRTTPELRFIERGMAKWAKSAPLDEVLDPRMEWRGEFYSQILAALKLGLMCTQSSPSDRPTMARVVQILEDLEGAGEELPKRVAYT